MFEFILKDQASMSAFKAFSSMKARRGSTSSPIKQENIRCLNRICDRHLQHVTIVWIHGRFPQLLCIHLAQTFITLDHHATT